MIAALYVALWVAQTRELNVYAAASLKETFEAIAKQFEEKNPTLRLRLEFGGSQGLAAQINQGAPADIFASANENDLDKVAYYPVTRRVFATNRLVAIYPAQGPRLADFRALSHSKAIVLAAPVVPAGGYARQALDSAAERFGADWRQSVKSHVVSEETDVRAVLTKVELGEADAGIVYATDALAGKGKVRVVSIPSAFQPRIIYPMAVIRGSKLVPEAKGFLEQVLSPAGQSVLRRHGFLPPPKEG